MEEEKLQEAKKTFEEDCDKFNRYLEDVETEANKKAEEVKGLVARKNRKLEKIG